MLYLASQSSVRQQILSAAGIPFQSIPSRIDEDSLKTALTAEGASARDIADTLAEYKARKIANKHTGYVLGCDQVLSFGGALFGKPHNQVALIDLFDQMAGRRHSLFTANVLYKDGSPIWRHVGRVDLTLRDLSLAEMTAYLNEHWDDVKQSAGGYHVETTPHLFDDIKGDWFDILGLSLSPLLNVLAAHDIAPNAKRPRLAGVYGDPIKQSKSPTLHGHWLKTYGLNGMYTPIHVPPDQFARTTERLVTAGFSGVNVTLPHKENARATADQLTDAAKSIGAANTLVFKDGQITADNTDAFGFSENVLSGLGGWSFENQTCLVLGAGGAARAVVWALCQAGAKTVFLTNRTAAKAAQLANEFGAQVNVLDWDDRAAKNTALDFVVNTTSLGMDGQPALDFDVTGLNQNAVVTDIVYKPLETDLLINAKRLGCRTVDGLGMLLHQAAPGFEAWFGQKPIVDETLRQVVIG